MYYERRNTPARQSNLKRLDLGSALILAASLLTLSALLSVLPLTLAAAYALYIESGAAVLDANALVFPFIVAALALMYLVHDLLKPEALSKMSPVLLIIEPVG